MTQVIPTTEGRSVMPWWGWALLAAWPLVAVVVALLLGAQIKRRGW